MQTIRRFFWVLWGFMLSPICQAQNGLDTLYKIQDGYKTFTEMYAFNEDSALLLCTSLDYNVPDSLRFHYIQLFNLNLKNGNLKPYARIQKPFHSIYSVAYRSSADSTRFIFCYEDSVNSKAYIAQKLHTWDSALTSPLGIPLANYRGCAMQKTEAGFIFTGTVGFNTNSPTFIAFFDYQFNLKRYYTYPFNSRLYSIIPVAANRYIISGYRTINDVPGVYFRMHTLCIDSMGKIQWEDLHTGEEYYRSCGYKDEAVFYKNKLYLYGIVSDRWYTITAAINITDTSGIILKECRYPMGYSSYINKIIEHRGSLYALCLIDTVFPGDSVLDQCMALLKINPENGEVIWTQRYRHWSRMNGMYNIYAINNQLYLLGYAINPKRLAEMDSINQVQPDAWLLRVDTNGCVVPGCNPLVNGVTHYLLDDNEWIHVYPNPAGKQFSIVFKEQFKPGACQIYLYDATGKQLMQQTYSHLPKEITLQHNSTYSGMAYLVIITADGNYYRKMVLK